MTICVKNRECIFGSIHKGEMVLNDAGQMVQKCWTALIHTFTNIDMDEFFIMPNHMHGIIVINDACRGGVTPPLRKHALGQIVAYYKYQTTKQINEIRNSPGIPVWQRNYFERIIRNEEELTRIREYIINNPLKWDEDEYNPGNL